MRSTSKVLSLYLFVLLAVAAPCSLLAADAAPGMENGVETLREIPRQVSDAVTTTLKYDDGEADSAVRPSSGQIEYAQQFVAPDASNILSAFSVCLQRESGDPADGSIGINIYQDSGAGPGALLRQITGNVHNVTTSFSGAFHVFDTTVLNPLISVPKNFYIGIVLNRSDNDFYLCLDYDGIAGNRPVYRSVGGGPWTNYRNTNPSVSALMVRAAVDSQGTGPTACNAGGDAVYLLGGRFRFDACWRTNNGATGTGKLATVSGTGATLWFFNANNPELFVKVRDACVAPFNRYWVFAAGLTNVEVTLTVTDLQKGVSETYVNPLGSAFASVQDTDSFATCP